MIHKLTAGSGAEACGKRGSRLVREPSLTVA